MFIYIHNFILRTFSRHYIILSLIYFLILFCFRKLLHRADTERINKVPALSAWYTQMQLDRILLWTRSTNLHPLPSISDNDEETSFLTSLTSSLKNNPQLAPTLLPKILFECIVSCCLFSFLFTYFTLF